VLAFFLRPSFSSLLVREKVCDILELAYTPLEPLFTLYSPSLEPEHAALCGDRSRIHLSDTSDLRHCIMADGSESDQKDEASKAISAFTDCVNESTLLDLAIRFSETYSRLAKTSLDQFLVTPVTALPTGKEKGKFISIDVGGTNLRVGLIELVGEVDNGIRNGEHQPFEKIKRSHDKSWPIGDHLKMDQAEDLFAWIGDCIAEIITDALNEMPASASVESPFGEELLLGITFSFPMA
jgi:hypothetical protein